MESAKRGRKRALSTTASEQPEQQAGPKRRRFGDPGLIRGIPQQEKNPLTGPEFTRAIGAITSAAAAPVHTHVSIPLQYAGGRKSTALELNATFSAKRHYAKERRRAWTQGMLDPIAGSSYEDILPATMDLERASLETRVMRKLELGSDYQFPEHRFADTSKTSLLGRHKHAGKIGLQSHLEEITARLALHLEDVGSGMRATTAATLWRMRTEGTQSEAGFRDKMYQRFPQLLTSDSEPRGGAAYYNELISSQMSRGRKSTAQRELWGQVELAHRDANFEGARRFDYKFEEIKARRMTTRQAGKWWVETFGERGRPTDARKVDTYRSEYLTHKLQRHGITHFVD